MMSDYTIVLTRHESQSIDRQAIEEFGIPAIVLMENAGRSVANFLQSRYTTGKIVICCGKGNNAGDGLVVARHLDCSGIPVQVLLFSSPNGFTQEAKINYNIVAKSNISIMPCYVKNNIEQEVKDQLNHAAWLVDALFNIMTIAIYSWY